ncbi:MAG: hypothetical protein ACTHOU_13495 [Aureliella sp.]
MKFKHLSALALVVFSGSLVFLTACGGPPVDSNASQGSVAPQEEDPEAYDKAQAKLNRGR